MSDDHKRNRFNGFLLTHAKDLAAVFVLIGMAYAGMTHFATAADVEKKYNSLRIEIKVSTLEGRKARIEDELFRLRSDGGKSAGTSAQIQRYESELRDVSQRLRDLEKDRR